MSLATRLSIPAGSDTQVFLYVCASQTIAKAGVTRGPTDRLYSLQRKMGRLVAAKFFALDGHEARIREAAIARAFGNPTGTRGRASEYFPAEHFDAACQIAASVVREFRPKRLAAMRNWARYEIGFSASRAEIEAWLAKHSPLHSGGASPAGQACREAG